MHLFVCNLTCNTEDVLKIAWLDLSGVKNIDKLPVPSYFLQVLLYEIRNMHATGIYSLLTNNFP